MTNEAPKLDAGAIATPYDADIERCKREVKDARLPSKIGFWSDNLRRAESCQRSYREGYKAALDVAQGERDALREALKKYRERLRNDYSDESELVERIITEYEAALKEQR